MVEESYGVMIFVSFYYYLFVILLLAVYYLIPLKYRYYPLLVGSMMFYWHVSQRSKKCFLSLIVMVFICWSMSQYMEANNKDKKICLFIALASVVIPLLVVKEANFTLWMFAHKAVPSWWFVPIGIAFYSMQLIAYVVDVYKGEITAERNFLKFLLFVSFFPQIIQGPIPRYQQLAHQLSDGNRFDERKFVKGFILILWGFFLKLCIADKAGIVVDKVFNNFPAYQGMYVLLAGILYSFQLYADFLSCTTLAQGVSGLFGIDIVDNFNHPYFSRSIKEFWRRWHMSLSSWLRDYVYIPLGGNRSGKIRKYLNLIITFAISGIWHGGGFKYLFWGLLHGGYQIIGEVSLPVKKVMCNKLNLGEKSRILKVSNTIITFVLVMLAWIIFRADHLKTGLKMIKTILTVHNFWIFTNDSIYGLGLGWKEFHMLVFCFIALLVVSYRQEKGMDIAEKILNCKLVVRWGIYIGMIIFVLIFGTYGYGYDPQAFIYGGF